MPTSGTPSANPERVLVSALSTLERRTLLYLAPRLPAWVNSDHLTVLALLAMVGAGLSFWLAGTWRGGLVLVVVCLAVNWFGDSLDGTLARVRGHERPRYGYYVDHIVDALGAVCLFGGMALSGFMHPAIAMGLLLAYLLLAIEVYLAAVSIGKFQLTHLMMGPTELRVLLSLGTLWLFVKPEVRLFGQDYRLFDVGGAVGIAAMVGLFLFTAARHTRQLYREEPLSGRRG